MQRVGDNLTNCSVLWRTVDSSASSAPRDNGAHVAGGAAPASGLGDYEADNGTLAFGRGVRRATIRVRVLRDGAYDGPTDEQFAVVLSEPSGATLIDGCVRRRRRRRAASRRARSFVLRRARSATSRG